jgi:hypothetical protein
MYRDDDIVESAHAIRPHLGFLAGAAAEGIGAQLAALLEKAGQGEPVASDILELLAGNDATRAWLARHLLTRSPAEWAKSYLPAPGGGEPLPTPRYRCPKGDYIWFRHTLGRDIPKCPTHKLVLVLDGLG